jgi:hypothetical protein
MRPLKPGSQASLILAHLARGKTLTPLSALHLFDCWRLGGRIHELRTRGWDIQTKAQMLPSGKLIARYSM